VAVSGIDEAGLQDDWLAGNLTTKFTAIGDLNSDRSRSLHNVVNHLWYVKSQGLYNISRLGFDTHEI
jgi:hypothetical protein